MSKKIFAKAVERALRENGLDAIKKKNTFHGMLETMSGDFALEKKYLQKYADGQWLKICGRAGSADIEELQTISRQAADYLCEKTDIGRKAARHLSKGMVVGIAAGSRNLSVDEILQGAAAPSLGPKGQEEPEELYDYGEEYPKEYPNEYPYEYQYEHQYDFDDYSEPVPRRNAGKRKRVPVIIAAALAVMLAGFGAVYATGGISMDPGADQSETTEEIAEEADSDGSYEDDYDEDEDYDDESSDEDTDSEDSGNETGEIELDGQIGEYLANYGESVESAHDAEELAAFHWHGMRGNDPNDEFADGMQTYSEPVGNGDYIVYFYKGYDEANGEPWVYDSYYVTSDGEIYQYYDDKTDWMD